jgi:FkbM family methyltransferase
MKKIFKHIYKIFPFKQSIFKVLRSFGLSDNITRHLVFNGIITLKADDKSFKMINKGYYLEQLFFWKGLDAWEKLSSHLWRALAEKSDVIFDVGANTGVYTLLAKAYNPSATIYAFEPIERIYTLLDQNIKLNRLQHTTIVNKAVSNQVGVVEMHDMDEGNLYEASLETKYIDGLSYDKKRFRKRKVEVETIDHFVQANKITQIDLIKIDVETHEPKVIEGMQESLKHFRPIILIEILNRDVANGISVHFEGLNYVYYNINEVTGYERVNHIMPSTHFNYVLCPFEKDKTLQEIMQSVHP